ncbi:MAG: hypothetical protein [Circular genetic element sp.]|nr:MAG: hypothetical protein [Circular genetic element sp.]
MSRKNSKTKVDASQNKRLAKLERNFPLVNETVSLNVSDSLTGTIPSKLVKLVPTDLDSEKIEFRGFSLRAQIGNNIAATDPNNLVYRVIILQYKCTAVYAAAGATYTEPLISDILEPGAANTPLANYNQDNSSRMRVLYDSQSSTDITRGTNLFQRKRMYKKAITQQPLVDKAFVMRPFVLFCSNMAGAGSDAVSVAANIQTYTRQLP